MGEPSMEGVDELAEDRGEQTTIGKTLRSCVKKGVAFHNAGLTNEQRRFVESNFKKGNIKCIVATPTLAAGINLPARRVIIRDVTRFENGGQSAIPVMEIKQMCGRAGRPRFDPYGEAVLIAKDEDNYRFLRDNYLLGESEEIYSKLGSNPSCAPMCSPHWHTGNRLLPGRSWTSSTPLSSPTRPPCLVSRRRQTT